MQGISRLQTAPTTDCHGLVQGLSQLQSATTTIKTAAAKTTWAGDSGPVGAACSRDGWCREYRDYKSLLQRLRWLVQERIAVTKRCHKKLPLPVALPLWERLAAAMAGAGNIAITNRSYNGCDDWCKKESQLQSAATKNFHCRWPYPCGSGLQPRWLVQEISRLQIAPTTVAMADARKDRGCKALPQKTSIAAPTAGVKETISCPSENSH